MATDQRAEYAARNATGRAGAFLLGRRSNRHDLVLARVDRRRDAADAAALAGGVRTLEGQNQRMLLELGMTHRVRTAALPLGASCVS